MSSYCSFADETFLSPRTAESSKANHARKSLEEDLMYLQREYKVIKKDKKLL